MRSARTPLACLAAALAACGCGEDGGGAVRGPGADRDPGAWAVETAGRTVVAEVNGEPVFADCVATQMEGRELSRREALDQCIEIELLAQAARRRGYMGDPEVAETRRREMVRALIDRAFYAEYQSPADIPEADVRLLWDRQFKHYFNRPENRSMAFCRAEAPNPNREISAEGMEKDRHARALARAIHARLRGRTDLEIDELRAICEEVAAEHPDATLSWSKGTFNPSNVDPDFGKALFAIREVGTVSPPTRTRWGWDVILLTHVLPARTSSLAEAEAELRDMLFNDPKFEPYRAKHFERWLHGLLKKHRVERFDDNLPAEPAERRPG